MKESYSTLTEAMKDYLVDVAEYEKQVAKEHKATKAVLLYLSYADCTYKVTRNGDFMGRRKPSLPPGYKTALRLRFTEPGKIVDQFLCLTWEGHLTETGIKLYEDLEKFPSYLTYMEKVK